MLFSFKYNCGRGGYECMCRCFSVSSITVVVVGMSVCVDVGGMSILCYCAGGRCAR